MLSGDPISQLGITSIQSEQKFDRIKIHLCVLEWIKLIDRVLRQGENASKLLSKSLPTRQFTAQRGLKNPKKIEKWMVTQSLVEVAVLSL